MDRRKLENLLQSVASRELTPEAAFSQLKHFPYQDLGYARLDLHRTIRQGLPEVIFCPGKTARQVIEIAQNLKESHELVVATKACEQLAANVLKELPEAIYYQSAQLILWGQMPTESESSPTVAVVTAGTADITVAEEAALILLAKGIKVKRFYDVGVAGIHRLIDNLEDLQKCAVSIVVAGMDGALPSVVGGLLEGPVIAVPTSVGYGTSFQGIAALLCMLNSCAAGLTVVNIDNGFGAAVATVRILSRVKASLN